MGLVAVGVGGRWSCVRLAGAPRRAAAPCGLGAGFRTVRGRLGCVPLGVILVSGHSQRSDFAALPLCRYFFGAFMPPERVEPQTVIFNQADGQNLKLDVFLPTIPTNGRCAAVIVVHGGGCDSRDKTDFPQWDQWLAQQGYAVFDIQYRLHPQPNWQTATGDVKCAIGWVKRHAASYGVDPQRLALLGRSGPARWRP